MFNSKDLPRLGHALENMRPAIGEVDARAEHEHLDRGRHEHFAGACQRRDARTDVDSETSDVSCAPLHLARVEASTNLDADLLDRLRRRARALDRASGAVEDGEE